MSRSLSRTTHQITPSRIEGVSRGCLRRWAMAAVFGQTEPPTEAQKKGTRLHMLVENWFRLGVLPKQDTEEGSWAQALINELPSPSPKVLPEMPVQCPSVFTRSRDTTPTESAAPVEWIIPGTADLVDSGEQTLYDYKTTKNASYVPSIAELLERPQRIAYAAALVHTLGWDEIICSWMYVCKDTGDVIPVATVETRAEVLERWHSICVPVVLSMIRVYTTQPKILDVDPNREACYSYGKPCPFIGTCIDVHGAAKGVAVVAKDTKGAKALEEKKMSVWDQLKKSTETPSPEVKATPLPAAHPPGAPGSGEGAGLEQLAKLLGNAPVAVNPPEYPRQPVDDAPVAVVEGPKKRAAGRRKKAMTLENIPPVIGLDELPNTVAFCENYDGPPEAAGQTTAGEAALVATLRATSIPMVPSFEPTEIEQTGGRYPTLLCLDCAPKDGRSYEILSRWVEDICNEVAAANEVGHWSQIQYGAGSGLLVEALNDKVSAQGLPPILRVDTMTPEGKALQVRLEQLCAYVVAR